MKIYLVGGAVRDQLLHRPIKERDWVVVGATPQQLLDQGFQPVGKDFPVFLHPKTKEEYALARTERKTGQGYKGFACYAAPDVTLEQDLLRRDLTINAMAQTEDGEIIDPYGGLADLQQRSLRHVSPAFVEDPLRVLRIARFAARFADFYVHDSTQQLMRKMVQSGEINALVPERVWKEFERALTEPAAQRFFTVLQQCGALSILFPELAAQPQAFATLEKITAVTNDTISRFAALTYGLTTDAINTLVERYRVPRDYHAFALLAAENYQFVQQLMTDDAEAILNLFEHCDALRRSERFQRFLQLYQALNNDQAKVSILNQALAAALQTSTLELQKQELKGLEFAKKLRENRLLEISKVI